jgi:hypothetical protein
MEKAKDPNQRDTHTTTTMTKQRWGQHALLDEFAERQYPEDSSYRTISRNMTGRWSHNHVYQIICKQ